MADDLGAVEGGVDVGGNEAGEVADHLRGGMLPGLDRAARPSGPAGTALMWVTTGLSARVIDAAARSRDSCSRRRMPPCPFMAGCRRPFTERPLFAGRTGHGEVVPP